MKLFARLRSLGKVEPASAIPAIPAIPAPPNAVTGIENSKIAGIAVAKSKKPITDDYLRQFRFDLVQDEESAGLAVADLYRCNNIAHHLIMVQGWKFPEAMKAAAEWVITNDQHEDEKMFDDVMLIWRLYGMP